MFRRKKLKAPLNNEGSQQIQRQKSKHNLASDSSYVKEYSTASELDRNSSKRISGSSIKNLLAEEMSKETESKRRSPSLVERLMGLDGLPTQQATTHRQHKISKDRTIPEATEIRRNPYEGRPYVRSSRGSPEFKDVYEVSEEREYVNSKNSEAEMNFITQKFVDAKRLSADDRFHSAEEFRNTLDPLDTNKELLMKFLQQPDSLYKKHLIDLQGASPMSYCSYMQPIPERCGNKNITSKLKKRTSSSSKYRKENFGSFSPNSYSPRSSIDSTKSSEIPLEGKHETGVLHTRIVVLKPNLDKLQNAKKHGPSHRRQVEYQSDSSEETRQLGGKSLPSNVAFSRSNMRESREKAKAIASRMSRSLGKEPIDFPSIFQGYAGDESSYNVSGSDSGSEQESMLSVRKSFHWSNRRNATSSNSRESSINKEAKKRLSKRWNLSQGHLDVDSACKISKLGEMLAKPDREMKRDKLGPKLVPYVSRGRVSDTDIMDLGMYSQNVSGSGFISDSSPNCYNPESSTRFRKPNQVRKLIVKEPVNGDRNKAINENVTRIIDSPMRNRRPETKEPQQHRRSGDGADVVEKYQYRMNFGDNIPSEKMSLVSRVDAECVSKRYSRGSFYDFSLQQSSSPPGIKNSSAPDSKDSEQECPVPDVHSPLSSKEPDQPSPVSVLEAPLTEDISSGSECFEKVSADLQELRMQLKLLRMESREGENNLTLSDKDDKEESFSEIDENAMLEYAIWQTSYINDVIRQSGFDSSDPNMIVAIWHSLECPITPWVFDKLEKKYSRDKSRSKSDRRLLFDRINCGLVEIFGWLVDPYPWVETKRSKFFHELGENGVRNELEKVLANEENYTTEKVLDKEMEWFDFGDEVDVIGRELEKLVINDLIDELVYLYVI